MSASASPGTLLQPAQRASPLQQPSTSTIINGQRSPIESNVTATKEGRSSRSKLRLPSTIEPALLPLIQVRRQAFSDALTADQESVLQPRYDTPFSSANDVVRRLLPYHVWQVNDQDLSWILDRGDEKEREFTSSTTPKRKLKRVDDPESIFPSEQQAYELFSKFAEIHTRAKRLRFELTGGMGGSEGTLFYKESLYNIERKALQYERDLLSAEQDKLRQEKEKAIEAGVSWETLMRLGPTFGHAVSASTMVDTAGNGPAAALTTTTPASPSRTASSSITFQKSVGASTAEIMASPGRPPNSAPSLPQPASPSVTTGNGGARPTTPASGPVKGSRPRGRPRKSRDQDGKIIPTPSLERKANMPAKNVSPMSSTSPYRPNQAPSLARPPIATPPAPVPAGPAPSVIPSHPIPLVLPLSTLAQLSALGIAPVPAPHLLPAISAQQAQAQAQRRPTDTPAATLAISASPHVTAPRPAPLDQQEPALLMGITEAPILRRVVSESGKLSSPTQQMLHVSVVLSRLSPSQLSGLAALMQSLQSSPSGENRTSAAPSGIATGEAGVTSATSPNEPRDTPHNPSSGKSQ